MISAFKLEKKKPADSMLDGNNLPEWFEVVDKEWFKENIVPTLSKELKEEFKEELKSLKIID